MKRMVENGMLDYKERLVAEPVCPVCGKECETFYFDWYGDVVGCDECITTGPAQEEEDENESVGF